MFIRGANRCNNCHTPTERKGPVFAEHSCSELCDTDLNDMLEADGPGGFYLEIVARGRSAKCDCTAYCKHCQAAIDGGCS
jgi:hypothetical protein